MIDVKVLESFQRVVFHFVDSTEEALLLLEQSRHIRQDASQRRGIVSLVYGTSVREPLLESLQEIVRLVQFVTQFFLDVIQIVIPIARIVFLRLWRMRGGDQPDPISFGSQLQHRNNGVNLNMDWKIKSRI